MVYRIDKIELRVKGACAMQVVRIPAEARFRAISSAARFETQAAVRRLWTSSPDGRRTDPDARSTQMCGGHPACATLAFTSNVSGPALGDWTPK